MKTFPLVSYAVQSKGPVLSGLMLDNGVALMAACLERAGYKPVIFDLNNTDTIEQIARKGKEGFLQDTIDSLHEYYSSNGVRAAGVKLYINGFSDSVRIHEELKRRIPGLRIAAGGPSVSWFRDRIFDCTDAFDVLCYGDGDAAMADIANLFYKGTGNPDEIPGIIYKGDSRRGTTKRRDSGLDNLPLPLYDEDVYLGIDRKMKIPVVEDSRGCPYSACSFCIHPRIGGKFRERSVQSVAAEMNHNRKRYGFRFSRLSGPSPGAGYISTLLNEVPDGVGLSAFGPSEGEYDYRGISGKMIAVFLGIESADRRVLKGVLLKTKDPEAYLSRARSLICNLKGNGVATITSMIAPVADDTQESMERSLDFLLEMQPDFAPVSPLTPMPGTKLSRRMESGKDIGIRTDPDWEERMMSMDVDLLRPASSWPRVPWQLRIDGRWEEPFQASQRFSSRLIEKGIYPLSDEIVLMSYLYYGGLNPDQAERRKQCLGFMNAAREDILSGKADGIREMVMRINENQLRKAA
jgi:radical SAM superfamily enzyme YgiQ (UPF0313 family)